MRIIFATNTNLLYRECLDRAGAERHLLSYFYLKGLKENYLEEYVNHTNVVRTEKPNGALVRQRLKEPRK